jgi:hypothetical protein
MIYKKIGLDNLGRMPTCFRCVVVLDSMTYPLCTNVNGLKLCKTTTWIKMCVFSGSGEEP